MRPSDVIGLVLPEAWRKTLPDEGKRWTHPSTIWKKWQESLRPPRDYKNARPQERKEAVDAALADQLIAKTKQNAELQVAAPRSIDLHHAPLDELEAWFEAGCLRREREDWLRDLLNRRHACRQPMLQVIPTADDTAEDDIGLH